jgi:4-hydroxybenzoate polyprenyltransferase
VFDAGFAMLAGGFSLVVGLSVATGAGWPPILAVVGLGSAIIFYDAFHKRNPLAPLVMGLCRAGVYATAALCVRPDLCPEVLLGIGVLIAYLIGLTYIARFENLRALGTAWPLAFLAVPFVAARPCNALSMIIYLALAGWVLRALMLLRARRIRDVVISLIAGISLVDALWIARLDRPGLAAAAIAAFVLTNLLQRVVPGT